MSVRACRLALGGRWWADDVDRSAAAPSKRNIFAVTDKLWNVVVVVVVVVGRSAPSRMEQVLVAAPGRSSRSKRVERKVEKTGGIRDTIGGTHRYLQIRIFIYREHDRTPPYYFCLVMLVNFVLIETMSTGSNNDARISQPV